MCEICQKLFDEWLGKYRSEGNDERGYAYPIVEAAWKAGCKFGKEVVKEGNNVTIKNIDIDENGEYKEVIIPEEMVQKLGWNEYTVLSVVEVNGEIQVRQKTDWTVDQLQEGDNLEKVLEDIKNNKTIHTVTHNGKQCVMVPHSKELEDEIDKLKDIK